jgi:hypothetical protein
MRPGQPNSKPNQKIQNTDGGVNLPQTRHPFFRGKDEKKKKIGNGPNRTELLLQILEYQLGIERECAAAVQVLFLDS